MVNTLQAPPSTQPAYEITDEDRKRAKRIESAWKAYEGDFKKPFDKMTDEPDMNIISNRVVEFVNASNDFLFAKELQITCDEGSPANAQKFLDDTWGRKETRIPFLLRLGLNGAISIGYKFLILAWLQTITIGNLQVSHTIGSIHFHLYFRVKISLGLIAFGGILM